ncbi:MAG: hypothetical protein HZB38_10705 [Planctomycetes bacterium]|nr:hypothetical protein [Planctomycetota bacterium]
MLHEHSVDYPNYSPIVLAYGAPGTYWLADSVDLATVGMESFNGTDGECLDTCDLLTNLPPSNFIFYPLNNDLCEDATPLTPDALQSGDLRFAHNTAGTCNTTNADRWFQFYAPCSGTLTVDTCGTNDVGGTDQGIDTILSATSSCPGGGGIVLACDDDGGTTCGDQGVVRDSRLVLNVQGGSTVYIRVSSFAPITTRGYFRLNSSFTSAGGRPANDDCAQAQPIGAADSASGNLLCATIDGSDDFGFPGRDVWYRFDHTLAGTLRVTTCGTHDLFGIDTGIDTVLSVHGGCPGNAQNQIAVNDDAPFSVCGAADQAFGFDSLVYAPLQAGQTAQIRVRPLGDNPRTGDYRVQTFFLVGDLDGDCDVDLQDLAFLLSHFGQSGSGLTGDIDGDNNVSLQDLAHVLSNFGFGCP